MTSMQHLRTQVMLSSKWKKYPFKHRKKLQDLHRFDVTSPNSRPKVAQVKVVLLRFFAIFLHKRHTNVHDDDISGCGETFVDAGGTFYVCTRRRLGCFGTQRDPVVLCCINHPWLHRKWHIQDTVLATKSWGFKKIVPFAKKKHHAQTCFLCRKCAEYIWLLLKNINHRVVVWFKTTSQTKHLSATTASHRFSLLSKISHQLTCILHPGHQISPRSLWHMASCEGTKNNFDMVLRLTSYTKEHTCHGTIPSLEVYMKYHKNWHQEAM